MTFEADLTEAQASGNPFRVVHDLQSGPRVEYLTAEEITAAQAVVAAEAAQAPYRAIKLIEAETPITQRHIRELTLALAAQAGQITAAMINPQQALDTAAPAWLALSVGVQKCVLQERAIRVERAKL